MGLTKYLFAVVFVIALLPAAHAAYACCVEDRSGTAFCSLDAPYLNVFDADIALCDALPGFYSIPDTLCFPEPNVVAPTLAQCQLGCGCPTDGGVVADLASSDFIGPYTLDQFSLVEANFPQYSWNFVPQGFAVSSCTDVCGTPGSTFDNTQDCEGAGFFVCATGDSPGNEILQYSPGAGLSCYDQPCVTQDDCSLAGGQQLQPGYYCTSPFLNNIDQCCAVGDEAIATCAVPYNGVVCGNTNAVCRGQDFTNLLFPNQLASGAKCCEDVGANSCQVGTCQNTFGYTTELYCRDGIDNDCDGSFDSTDTDCNSQIAGTVLDVSGNPVGGIFLRFTVTPAFDTSIPEEVYTVASRPDGTYSISGIAAGDYVVELSAGQSLWTLIDVSGPNPFAVNQDPLGTVVTKDITIRAQGNNVLSGTVTDDLGQPVEGASVFLANTAYVSYTDVNGDYSINDVNDGDYVAYAYKDGYELSASRPLTITADTTADFVLVNLVCTPDLSWELDYNHVAIGSFDLQLIWEELGCGFSSARLMRCDGTTGICPQNNLNNYISIHSINVSDPGSFIDSSTTNNTFYTYMIEVTDTNNVKYYTTPIEIYSGDWQCQYAQNIVDQFCVLVEDRNGVESIDAGYQCDEENRAVVAVSNLVEVNCIGDALRCNEYSLSSGRILTQCSPTIPQCSNLDALGAPFNLFAYDNTGETCSEQDGCYYDTGDTNVNACLACSDSTVCSSYTSQESCGADPCGVSGAAGACSWVWFNEPLGIGTCKQPDEPDCEACQSNNEVLGKCPDRDTCEQVFGLGTDACYFSETFGTCSDCAASTCYDYITQDECIGGTSRGVFDIATLRFSDQYPGACSLGTCGYDGSGIPSCFRDMNNDGHDDCAQPEFIPGNGFDIVDCRANTQPPQTNVFIDPLYIPDQGATVRFTTQDDIHGPLLTTVWYCIEDGDLDAPVDCSFLDAFAKLEGFHEFDLNGYTHVPLEPTGLQFDMLPGTNTLFYFGEDFFNNLEMMQHATFEIDNVPPVVTVDAQEFRENGLTNVILQATTNEPADCRLELSLASDGTCYNNNCDFYDGFFDTVQTRALNGVTDGAYIIEAVCIDRSGNEGRDTLNAVFNADTRSFNPEPTGIIEQTTVDLVVRTTDFTLCKYSDELLQYFEISDNQIIDTNPQFSAADNGYVHSRTLNLPANVEYQYHIVCNFDPPAVEFVNFVIDTAAPTVSVFAGLEELDVVDSPHVLDNGNIRIMCEDEPENGFGCEQIRMCTTPIGTNCAVSPTGETVIDLSIGGNTKLCVQGVESVVDGRGQKSGSLDCHEFVVDLVRPSLFITDYPEVSNSRDVTISGTVLDFVYKDILWDPDTEVIVEQTSVAVSDVNISGTAYAEFDFGSTPVFDIVLRYAAADNYYALRLDGFSVEGNTGNPEAQLVRVTPNGEQVVARAFTPWQASGVDFWFAIENNEMSAVFGDARLGATDPQLPGSQGRQIGVREISGEVILENILAFDYAQLQTNTVEYYQEGGASLTTQANPDFAIATTLLTSSSGDTKTFTLQGIDRADKRSDTATLYITYDIEAPEIYGYDVLNISNDVVLDEVVVGEDTLLTVQVLDRGFGDTSTLATVTADIEYFGLLNLAYNITTQRWEAILPTSQWNSLGYHDVTITAVDRAGNSETVAFEQTTGTFIVDPTNTFIDLRSGNPIYTKDPRPSLDVGTERPAVCTLTYLDTVTDTFVTADDTNHTLTLSSSIPCQQDAELFSDAELFCRSLDDTIQVTIGVALVCDNLAPIASFSVPESFGHLESFDREAKQFTTLTGTAIPLVMQTDEESFCRYCNLDNPTCDASNTFTQMPVFFDSASNNIASQLHGGVTATFANTFNAIAICQDRAGNPSVPRQITLQDISQDDPLIRDFGPLRSLQNNVKVFVDVQQQNLLCLMDVPSLGITDFSLSSVESPTQGLTRYERLVQFPLGQDTYDVSVTCTKPSQTSSSDTVNFVVEAGVIPPQLSLDAVAERTNEPVITLSGSVVNAERLFVLRDGQPIVIHNASGQSSYSIPVGLRSGLQELAVVAVAEGFDYTDFDEDFISRNARVLQEQALSLVEVTGLRSYTSQSPFSTIDVYVAGDNVAGGQLQLTDLDNTILDSVDVIAEGEYTLTLSDVTEVGNARNYMLRLVKGTTIAANHFVYETNVFAEQIYTSVPYLSRESTDSILITQNYENLITNITVSISDEDFSTQVDPLDRFNVRAIGVPQGVHIVDVQAQNDLFQTSRLYGLTYQDSLPPQLLDFEIAGTGSTIAKTSLPSLRFVFDEPTQITFAQLYGDDPALLYDSGFAQEQTLLLDHSLSQEGVYGVYVEYRDGYDNAAQANVTFTYEKGNFSIELLEPEYGAADERTFDVVLQSDRVADCKYVRGESFPLFDNMVAFDASGGNYHYLYDFRIDDVERNSDTILITVLCDPTDGFPIDDTRTVFQVGYDLTNPAISSVTVVPSEQGTVIQSLGSVALVARTDEDVICRHRTLPVGGWVDNANYTAGNFSNPYSLPYPISDGQNYTVEVECTNRAGLTDVEQISFDVDFGQSAAVRIVSPTPGPTNQSNQDLFVTTNKPVDVQGCVYSINGGVDQVLGTSGSSFRVNGIIFPEGNNNIDVECTIESRQQSNSVQFTVDSTAPVLDEVVADAVTSGLSSLTFSVRARDDASGAEGSGLDTLSYEIGLANDLGILENITYFGTVNYEDDTYTITGLDLLVDETYYVRAQVTDKVGLSSAWKRSNGTLAKGTTGTCSDGVQGPDEVGVDCGGDCPACTQGFECLVDGDCTSGQCSNGICTTPSICSNGILDANETDVDCGGVCGPCSDGGTCDIDGDCQGLYCDAGICATATCSDGVRNGNEADLDCGGILCEACAAGKSCVFPGDCQSGICGDGLCAVPSCTDGVKNGEETDIDCGGTCGACGTGLACEKDGDCLSADCTLGICESSDRLTDDNDDSDSDGIPDGWERQYDLDPFDPSDAFEDPDGDSLTNFQEFNYEGLFGSLNPVDPDTDGDGFEDGIEATEDTDASDADDYPQTVWENILLLLGMSFLFAGLLAGGGYMWYREQHKPGSKLTTESIANMLGIHIKGKPAKKTLPPPAPPKKTVKRLSKKDKLRKALQHHLASVRRENTASNRKDTFDAFGEAKSASESAQSPKPRKQAVKTSKKTRTAKKVVPKGSAVEQLKQRKKARNSVSKLKKKIKPKKPSQVRTLKSRIKKK